MAEKIVFSPREKKYKFQKTYGDRPDSGRLPLVWRRNLLDIHSKIRQPIIIPG